MMTIRAGIRDAQECGAAEVSACTAAHRLFVGMCHTGVFTAMFLCDCILFSMHRPG